ncbi:hypothetical protein PGIGA_G00023090 [Pangasianodon gigas]|uniref:Uncharacterized protein n=1 Tax=Pangasianodon gigas TaxID=30993 RepID=A0ACC5WVS5_PANGG|nr:hypothetical protein [Pangasianodon gigas]
MKLLYFMALLIFGASGDPCNLSSKQGNRTGNYFLYNSTDLKIAENLTTLLCNWNSSQCYVECTFVNLTTNITDVDNKNAVENVLILGLSRTLVFKISEQKITCNVTKCVRDEINIPIKKVYISAEKNYIDALITPQFNGTTKNIDREEFNMDVVKMDMMNTPALGLVQISAPKVPGDDLPLDVFMPTEPFVNVSFGIVTYPSAQQFIHDPNTVLKSKVIRIETVGNESKHLSKRLFISFTLNSNEIISENQTLSCQFYDETEHKWNDMGSFTNLENFNSSNTVNCSYDHMTPFAVLLVDVAQINAQQWKILSYISYIGCSLSSFFSAVTIFLYVFMKSSNRDSSIRIHVSLSVALFLLNTSFLFIEWGATWSQDSVCVLIAVIIQYSLLSCFSWMAIEAIHLYLLLIKVFNTYIKHYMIKLSLFGWGEESDHVVYTATFTAI